MPTIRVNHKEGRCRFNVDNLQATTVAQLSQIIKERLKLHEASSVILSFAHSEPERQLEAPTTSRILVQDHTLAQEQVEHGSLLYAQCTPPSVSLLEQARQRVKSTFTRGRSAPPRGRSKSESEADGDDSSGQRPSRIQSIQHPVFRSGQGQGYCVVDLGYTKKLVPADELQDPWNQCALSCCPCCVGQPTVCSASHCADVRLAAVRTATGLVTLLQIAAFAIEILKSGGFAPLDQNAMLGPDECALLALGARSAPLIVRDFEVWRLLTPVFLHAGVVHLCGNLYFQLRYAMPLEYQWGCKRWLMIYWLAGLGGSLLGCLMNPLSVSVGASGALLGILGAETASLLVLRSREADGGGSDAEACRKLQSNLFTILFLFLIGSHVSFIDNWAHFGGLVTGFLCGISLLRGEAAPPVVSQMSLERSSALLRRARWRRAVAQIVLGVALVCSVALLWSPMYQVYLPLQPLSSIACP